MFALPRFFHGLKPMSEITKSAFADWVERAERDFPVGRASVPAKHLSAGTEARPTEH